MFKFIIITVLPIAFLLYYLRKQDQVKPEPKKKLAECFGLGMLGGVIGSLIIGVFSALGIGTGYDSLFYGDIIGALVEAAAFVSVVYFILWKHSEKNPYFDEFLDGPVYAVCIAFGYQILCDFFNVFTDDWVSVGLLTIMVVVAVYATAMVIGYYYSMARFGEMELTGKNKFKMWAVPVAIVWIYNCVCYWSNESVVGLIVAIVFFIAFGYYTYKKSNAIIAELKERDRVLEEQGQTVVPSDIVDEGE